MRLRVLVAPLTIALLGATASADDRPVQDIRYDRAIRPKVVEPLTRSATRTSVLSVERARGVPTFAMASQPFPSAPKAIPQQAEDVARHFLRERAALYRVSGSIVDQAELRHLHDTGRGGIIATFRHRIGGIEVFGNDTKVLLTRDLRLVAIGGSLRAEADGSHPLGSFLRGADEAVTRAFREMKGLTLGKAELENARPAAGGYTSFDMAPTGAVKKADLIFTIPARAKAIWFPVGDMLRPAHYVELFVGRLDETTSEAFAFVVAADDGQLLWRKNLTADAAFDYRVFVDGAGRPLDGPIADHTPHPTGIPDGSYPAFVAPVLTSMEGFNQNPDGQADPWLPDAAFQTFGNNVNAYTDDHAPDYFSANDVTATTTGPNAFDHVYDTGLDPIANDTQRMASVTQLFYVNNWLHDYFYDSGFDEAAGNAQLDNYGRGGEEGDPLEAQAQDGVGIGNQNNANMATPADGISPRMQMFVWSAQDDLTLSATPLNQGFATNSAQFGPTSFDITALVTLVDDGSGVTTDACQPIQNDLTGTIALIDRGSCTFKTKVNAAEAAGAVGAIIVNDDPMAGPMFMAGSNSGAPSIGALSMSFEDGNDMKAALTNGPVTATLQRVPGVRHDGTIDNMIVAHEWGHYIHHRLTLCSTNQCGGQSEGWGDFMSLFLAVRENDDWNGTFADAVYAPTSSSDPGYFGLRRAAYSVDPTKNALSFTHIQDGEDLPSGFPLQPSGAPNSEVHRTGEIWASMLFEGYYRMLMRTTGPSPAYGFAEAQRRMADYVVAGMKLAPPDPTFTEQRDAVLAAAGANDLDDMLALAEGFAARGAGSCAVSPPRDSTDNVGVVESDVVAPTLTIESVTMSDDLLSCDEDGRLDAGERGTLVIEVENRGPIALTDGAITLETNSAGVTLGDTVLSVDALNPYEVATVTAEVRLDPDVEDPGGLELDLLVDAPEACEPSYTRQQVIRINYDNVVDAGSSTDFDSDIIVMLPVGAEKDVIWGRDEYEPLDLVWRGIDIGHISDSYIETPELEVSADEDLVLTMVHRHRFEHDETTLWDAGVIEIKRTTDLSWTDVVDFDPSIPYDGPVSNLADNPLSDRDAFVAENPSWPDTDTVTVDLGDNFAGDKVKLRFRIGTDQAASDFGWEIHSLDFAGVINDPFPAIASDGTVCLTSPIANAGEDREVEPSASVTLDGSGSNDPEGDALTFAWNQIDGPSVTLDGAGGPSPEFEAPSEEGPVTFELTVSDGFSEDSDMVTIHVVSSAVDPMGPLKVGSGCGCEVVGESRIPSRAGYLLALAAAAALARRRRNG